MMLYENHHTQEQEEQLNRVCPVLRRYLNTKNSNDELLIPPFKNKKRIAESALVPNNWHMSETPISEETYLEEESNSAKLDPLRLASYPSEYFTIPDSEQEPASEKSDSLRLASYPSESLTLSDSEIERQQKAKSPKSSKKNKESDISFNPRRLSSLLITAIIALLAYTAAYRKTYQSNAVTVTAIPCLNTEDLDLTQPISPHKTVCFSNTPGISTHWHKKPQRRTINK